jgi:hypothetical protein
MANEQGRGKTALRNPIHILLFGKITINKGANNDQRPYQAKPSQPIDGRRCPYVRWAFAAARKCGRADQDGGHLHGSR